MIGDDTKSTVNNMASLGIESYEFLTDDLSLALLTS